MNHHSSFIFVAVIEYHDQNKTKELKQEKGFVSAFNSIIVGQSMQEL